MNTQELLNILKIVGSTMFGMLAMHGYMTSAQASAIMADLTVAVPALLSAGTMAWSIYAHWNMKKVPENSVAIPVEAVNDANHPGLQRGVPVPVGASVRLPDPVKVVGVLLVALLLSALIVPSAFAQSRPKLTGNIQADIAAATAPAPKLITGNVEKDAHAIWDKLVSASQPDLKYASALAASANTPASAVRKQCYDAIITLNTQVNGMNVKDANGVALPQPDPKLFTGVEQAAETIDNLSPSGPLFTNCAGMAQLMKTNVLTLVNAIVTGAAGFAAMPIIPGL